MLKKNKRENRREYKEGYREENGWNINWGRT
jgi:hypothetical protein